MFLYITIASVLIGAALNAELAERAVPGQVISENGLRAGGSTAVSSEPD